MTENAIATVDQRMIQPAFMSKLELVKETICRGATDDEFELFIYQARRLGLDPLSRQVYAIKRWDAQAKRDTMAIQISIDGARLIAERSGKYRGQTKPEWFDVELDRWVEVWIDPNPPAAARVGVYRADFAEPIYGVARFESFAARKKDGELTSMWQRFPEHMIAKVAEAQALRKAFPNELAGVYTDDEMSQTNASDRQSRGVKAAKDVQIEAVRARLSELEEILGPELVRDTIGDQHPKTLAEAKAALAKLEAAEEQTRSK